MKQLVFVYNADSGLFNTLTDFAHKIISPVTYACRLCALTYGNFNMKKEWKEFVQQLPFKSIFLHKDEFEKKYDLQTDLPAIYLYNDSEVPQIILSSSDINQCNTLEQLQDLITNKVYDQHHYSHL